MLLHKKVAVIKVFVVYNLTVASFALSCKNSSKPSRAISNNTIPYIQAEYFTQIKQWYNYRLSLDDALRLISAMDPIAVCLRDILTSPLIF